jgi:hypothetical protein
MNKKIVLSVVILILVGIGGFLVWNNLGGPTGEPPSERTINHFHPAEPGMIAQASNLTRLDEALSRLSVSNQFMQSNFYDLYRTRIQAMLAAFRNENYRTARQTLQTMEGYAGDRAIVYGTTDPLRMVAVQNLNNPDTGSKPSYEAVDRLINRSLNKLSSLSDVSINRSTHRQVTIRQIELALDSPDDETARSAQNYFNHLSPSIARLHGHLIIGVGPDAVREAIDRYARTSPQPESPIRSSSGSKPRIDYRISGRFLTQMYSSLESNLSEEIARQNQFSLNRRLAEGYEHQKGTLTFSGEYFKQTNELKWQPESMIEPIRTSMKQPPISLESPGYFPQDALFATAVSLPNARDLFDWYVEDVVKPTYFPSSEGDTSSQVLEETLPMSAFRQFLGSIDAEMGASLSLENQFFEQTFRDGAPPEDVLPVEGLAVFQVENYSRLNQALDSMDENPFITYNPLEQRLVIDYVFGERPIHLQKHGSYFLMALAPETIDRAVTSEENNAGLPQLKRYRTLRNKFPGKVNQLGYVSMAPFYEPLSRDWLERFLPERRQRIVSMTGFDPVQEFGLFLRGLPGTMSTSRNHPDQNRVTGKFLSSGDIVMPTMGIAGAVASYPWISGQLEGAAPSMQSQDTSTEQNADQNTENNGAVDQSEVGEGQAALSKAIFN